MSAEIKRCCRLYSLTDYEQEEKWLREMANKGWMLKSAKPIVYTFERADPQDIVFKLDFQSTRIQPDDDYMRMLEDYGWTYLTSLNNYRYLYKTASGNNDNDEIYTDNASKLEMLKRILRFRILPIMCVFFVCVIPNFVCVVNREFDSVTMDVLWIVLLILYCFALAKVGIGYKRLYKKFSKK